MATGANGTAVILGARDSNGKNSNTVTQDYTAGASHVRTTATDVLFPDYVPIPFSTSQTAATYTTPLLINACGLYKLLFTKSATSETVVITGVARKGVVHFVVSGLTGETLALTGYVDAGITVETGALSVYDVTATGAPALAAATALGNGSYRMLL